MIYFVSDGRLGNQIFQYAFLNSIAQNNEKVICINMNVFSSYFDFKNKNFVFLLGSKYKIFFFKKIFPKFLGFLVKFKAIGYVEQLRSDTSALPKVVEKKGVLPIRYVKTGFFQTEKLFKNDKIDFSIKEKFQIKAKKIFDKLPSHEKVFIHVRRGDYIFETFRGDLGIDLPKNYFDNAISLIETKVTNPFYIFLTDDPGYVECCFKEIENKYISRECMATDLALMSLCKYGVTSNSSFSWWGAYLSNRKEMMIFPKYWYGWKQKIHSHIDIQPSWGIVITPS